MRSRPPREAQRRQRPATSQKPLDSRRGTIVIWSATHAPRAPFGQLAAAAGVSIMTLYRHAGTRNDFFEAVVSEACAPPADSEELRAIETVLQQAVAA